MRTRGPSAEGRPEREDLWVASPALIRSRVSQAIVRPKVAKQCSVLQLSPGSRTIRQPLADRSRFLSESSPARPVVVVLSGGYAVYRSLAARRRRRRRTGRAEGSLRARRRALRALADPSWLERIYLPYDGLWAAAGDQGQGGLGQRRPGRARLGGRGPGLSGAGPRVQVPFPAKQDMDSTTRRTASARRARGAGPRGPGAAARGRAVGIELAGEIKAGWPGKQVALVEWPRRAGRAVPP